jgi:hypothetical protein
MTLLPDLGFKKALGGAFVRAFYTLSSQYVAGIGPENDSLLDLSVQLFTVPSIVRDHLPTTGDRLSQVDLITVFVLSLGRSIGVLSPRKGVGSLLQLIPGLAPSSSLLALASCAEAAGSLHAIRQSSSGGGNEHVGMEEEDGVKEGREGRGGEKEDDGKEGGKEDEKEDEKEEGGGGGESGKKKKKKRKKRKKGKKTNGGGAASSVALPPHILRHLCTMLLDSLALQPVNLGSKSLDMRRYWHVVTSFEYVLSIAPSAAVMLSAAACVSPRTHSDAHSPHGFPHGFPHGGAGGGCKEGKEGGKEGMEAMDVVSLAANATNGTDGDSGGGGSNGDRTNLGMFGVLLRIIGACQGMDGQVRV